LRHIEEIVKGKSLKISIEYWNEIKNEVEEILNGKVLNENS
jgi:hypothetical protein